MSYDGGKALVELCRDDSTMKFCYIFVAQIENMWFRDCQNQTKRGMNTERNEMGLIKVHTSGFLHEFILCSAFAQLPLM